MSCQITKDLVKQLEDRASFGEHKYHTTLDRKDLTPQQWLQHLTEELLDGAGYAQCAKREMDALLGALTRIRDFPISDTSYASAAHRMREIASNALAEYTICAKSSQS